MWILNTVSVGCKYWMLPNNCAIKILKMVLKALVMSYWTSNRQKNKETLLLKATWRWQKNQAQKKTAERQKNKEILPRMTWHGKRLIIRLWIKIGQKTRGWILMINHVLIDMFQFWFISSGALSLISYQNFHVSAKHNKFFYIGNIYSARVFIF